MFDYDELEKKKFQNMFNFMKDVEVTFGNLSDIKYNDVVFCKRSYINTNDYPLQSFIFGPSFDDMVMPSNKFYRILVTLIGQTVYLFLIVNARKPGLTLII